MTRRNQELEQALAEVRAATEARETLAATVRNLSVPVVSIFDQVIVLPLVGELDARRGQLLLDRLLAGVSEQRARIAILDASGHIVNVNRAWREFGAREGVAPAAIGVGADYLGVCDRAAAAGLPSAIRALAALRAVLNGSKREVNEEYAFESDEGTVWYLAQFSRFAGSGAPRAMVAHIGEADQPIVRWDSPFLCEEPGASPQWHDDEIGVAGCIMSLVEAVRNGAEPSYGALQGRLDQELILAIRKSSAEGGRPVELPLAAS